MTGSKGTDGELFVIIYSQQSFYHKEVTEVYFLYSYVLTLQYQYRYCPKNQTVVTV